MAHTGPMPLDLAFSFDTTGSMGSVIGQVRTNIAEMLDRLSADISDLKIALIAHGDYGDKYETEIRDFGTSTAELVNFVQTVSMTSGGDTPECYELVLRQARTNLSWRQNSSRALVLVGDSYPHELKSARNKYKIDWKAEVQLLRQLGVTVYCVQCNESREATEFMSSVAEATGGLRLPLAEFRNVRDFLMAIAYREGGTGALQDVYEREVRAREGAGLPGDVSAMLGLVRRMSAATSTASTKIVSTEKRKGAARPSKMSKAAAIEAAKKVTKVTKGVKTPVSAGSKALKTTRAATRMRVRVRRETCSTKNLPASFASLVWSPWRLIAQPGSVRMSRGSSWHPFGSGSVRRSLLSGRSQPSSVVGSLLVELAVQPRPGARRFPLFGRVLSFGAGGRRPRMSEATVQRLLSGRASVRAQLLRVLRQGMRVFARVATSVSSAHTGAAATDGSGLKLRPRLVKAASYAWNSGRSVRCSGVFVSVSKKSLQ